MEGWDRKTDEINKRHLKTGLNNVYIVEGYAVELIAVYNLSS